MLKSISHNRSSPIDSPVLHYAPTASHSLPASPLPRRRGPPGKSTPPQRTQYVDASTQWSPRSSVKMEPPRAEPTRLKVDSDPAPPAASKSSTPPIPAKLPSSPSTHLTQPGTPGLKRRGSRDTVPPVLSTSPPKRPKPDQAPPKILPSKYEFCPVEDMVVLIANMIQELIQTNDNLPLRSSVLTRFHSRTPPGISVLDYLQRLAKHATLTPPILLSMVYYMDRLCLLYAAFTINTLTVHRFLITAATVAAKGLSDSFWNNSTYARVGGIKTTELALLELDFLYRLDWKIVPNPEALTDYYRALIERSPTYDIETDNSEFEDESGDEESSDVAESSGENEVATEAANNEKWKAWIDDVSAKQAEGSHDDKPA